MKIKDNKCKCGHDDFFFADKKNQTGIYCSYCGKWLKWANKDEQNLRMKRIEYGTNGNSYKLSISNGKEYEQVELEGDDYGKCPKCGWEFEFGDKDWGEPYCCHCGQKLQWFEESEK